MIGCKPLSKEECAKILTELKSERDQVLFILGSKTGFRISELLSIKKEDAKKSSILVTKSHMKGQGASRSISISKDMQALLSSYIAKLPLNQEFLFASRENESLSRKQAYNIIKDAAIKAGLEGKIGTHSLRKSFAKRIYEASGKDLVMTQRAMGHKSINSTISYLSFYTDQDVQDLVLKAQD